MVKKLARLALATSPAALPAAPPVVGGMPPMPMPMRGEMMKPLPAKKKRGRGKSRR